MQLSDNSEYRASKDWPYAISAGCVVYRFKDDKLQVLLLKRAAGDFPELSDNDRDTFHLPKGGVERRETLEQTALRETAEEAGVEVVVRCYLGSSINEWVSHQGFQQHKTVHYFAGEWQKDLPSMDQEHSAKLWLPYGEALHVLQKQQNPKREERFLQNLQKYLERYA
ncbi:MAG: NUDIX domain-containing protein [Candidatus Saccharimonadales bacterium]